MPESISIIIPTYNEAEGIQQLISYLLKAGKDKVREIVVSDGGSTDQTQALAAEAGAIVVPSPKKGRAAQMNAGAQVATGELLYFLHADTYPPAKFAQLLTGSHSSGYGAGCFRLQFNDDHWFLKANAFFTRFDVDSVRFGDQSLFIRKDLFHSIGGFREDLVVMEDQEIIGRIRKVTHFKLIPVAVTTSAKKYRENGVYRLQAVFFLIWGLYYLGVPQLKLVNLYNRFIKKSKLKQAQGPK
ncbi:TIGR04283 family arsenosugar biosynthesis glycosyltransferase [Pontibacter sp. 13R65]|uniref:TIGR04283 family arsenosugar biosynthesis glycosyltransferase n=1 Tax=Pontibacter sp. 13R65 TaxID=3127458 RepID=UPI00301B76D0